MYHRRQPAQRNERGEAWRRAGRRLLASARFRHRAALGLLLLASVVAACRTAQPHRPPAEADRRGHLVERGLASWYGPGFEGRRTASGEVFDGELLTAAHRTLPFGTLVEVVNLDNGRAIRVRINDRGPFIRKRVIDLSRAAARELGVIGPGVAQVEIYLLSRGEASDGLYTVQVGAFMEAERARSLQAELALSYPAVAVRSDGTWHRVQVQRFDRRREAEKLRRELARRGYPAVVMRLAGDTA